HASTWGIGSRGRRSLRLLDVDDLARRDGLAHVADREAAQLGEGLVRLDDEGFRRPDFYPGRVAGLEAVGLLGLRRTGLRVEHRDEFLEGAGDLARVGVEDRGVARRGDAGVVEAGGLG